MALLFAHVVFGPLRLDNLINESLLLVLCLQLKALSCAEELILQNVVLLSDVHQLLVIEPLLEGLVCIAVLLRLKRSLHIYLVLEHLESVKLVLGL